MRKSAHKGYTHNMPKRKQTRKCPAQVNFRCTDEERAAYTELAEELEMPLTQIIREGLNELVSEHLGEGWISEDA